MLHLAAVVIAVSLTLGPPAQPGAPPRDGEIRTVYDAALDRTDVWLTIEPRSREGLATPAGMVLTVRRSFAGKAARVPAALFDVRVSAGLMAAPRPELSLVADGGEIDLAAGNPEALQKSAEGVSLSSTIPAETLKRAAAAGRLTGNALGFAFELTASQRQALRTFVARALGADPADAK